MKPVVKILEWDMTKKKLPKWHFHRWSNVIKIQLLKFSFCINEYIFWQIQIELINGFRCFVSFSFWKLFIRMFLFDSNQWNAVVWTRIAIFHFFGSIDWESLWSFPNKNFHLNKSNLIVTLLWHYCDLISCCEHFKSMIPKEMFYDCVWRLSLSL